MNQHEPALAPIKAPDGYRPVFNDMDGLTPTEYRVRQRQRAGDLPGSATPSRDEIMKAYRALGSWTAVAKAAGVSTYYVKKAVRGA